MTTLYVDNIAPNLQSKISAPNLTLPSGSVVQTLFVNNNTQTAFSGSTPQTFMTINITPTSANSKILVTYDAQISFDFGGGHAQSYIYRGTTPLGLSANPHNSVNKVWWVAETSDNNFGTVAGSFLDTPNTTDEVAYHIKMGTNNTSTMYANRRFSDADYYCTSSITVMEIAG